MEEGIQELSFERREYLSYVEMDIVYFKLGEEKGGFKYLVQKILSIVCIVL